jgi:hypothetical protein
MLCTGNSSEFCGAGNRLDVYQSVASIASTAGSGGSSTSSSTTSSSSTVSSSTVSSSSTDPSSSTTSSSSTAPSSTGPVHVASVGAYKWAGCYTEATNSRALTGASDINYNTMTVEICAAYCASYTMFGVEYSTSPNLYHNGLLTYLLRRRMLLRQYTKCRKCTSGT